METVNMLILQEFDAHIIMDTYHTFSGTIDIKFDDIYANRLIIDDRSNIRLKRWSI